MTMKHTLRSNISEDEIEIPEVVTAWLMNHPNFSMLKYQDGEYLSRFAEIVD